MLQFLIEKSSIENQSFWPKVPRRNDSSNFNYLLIIFLLYKYFNQLIERGKAIIIETCSQGGRIGVSTCLIFTAQPLIVFPMAPQNCYNGGVRTVPEAEARDEVWASQLRRLQAELDAERAVRIQLQSQVQ